MIPKTTIPVAALTLLLCACVARPSADDPDDGWGAPIEPVPPAAGGSGGAPSTDPGTGAGESPAPSCAGVFSGECGSCLEASCCAEVSACVSTPGCLECVTGQGAPGCDSAPAADALLQCGWLSCQQQCFEQGSGGGGAGGGGGGGGFDLVTCTGPASTTGNIYGVTPNATRGLVQPDPSGALQVILVPTLNTSVGDIVVVVYFFPSPGQLSYPPNGTVGCAVLEDQGSSWGVIDTTQLCELSLSALDFASAEGVCDGVIAGTFQGIFSGNQPLAGSFSLPLEVAESQTSPPACQPPNGPCAQHSDCCSNSCSLYIGVCN